MVVQVAELARSVAVWPAKRSPMGLMVGRSWLVEGLGGGLNEGGGEGRGGAGTAGISGPIWWALGRRDGANQSRMSPPGGLAFTGR